MALCATKKSSPLSLLDRRDETLNWCYAYCAYYRVSFAITAVESMPRAVQNSVKLPLRCIRYHCAVACHALSVVRSLLSNVWHAASLFCRALWRDALSRSAYASIRARRSSSYSLASVRYLLLKCVPASVAVAKGGSIMLSACELSSPLWHAVRSITTAQRLLLILIVTTLHNVATLCAALLVAGYDKLLATL